jgi:hypothetical protein
MKKFRLFFFILSGLVLTASLSFAQCTPDPSVTDPTGGGAMVPDSVEAQELVETNWTITFIAPTQVVDPTLGTVTIHSIVLKSIFNKPAWMAYACNPANATFLAGIPSCALITGTPPLGSAGVVVDSCVIDVYIPPIIPGGAPIRVKENYTYPTALKIYISPAAGVNELENNEYKLLAGKPNPFVNTTKIGVFTTKSEIIKLQVSDIIGKIVYTETLGASSGENYFNFDGQNLSSGVYIYSVINTDNQVISKKLIKTE